MIDLSKLSDELPPALDMLSCQKCGKECDLTRWEEHDDEDKPTGVLVILCDECSDQIIEKHPRLYRSLHQYEPSPGSMACCLNCPDRKGIECRHPALRKNGGSGLVIEFPKPSVVFIDGMTKGGGRRWGERRVIYHAPPKCRRIGLDE